MGACCGWSAGKAWVGVGWETAEVDGIKQIEPKVIITVAVNSVGHDSCTYRVRRIVVEVRALVHVG